jgi:DNA-binding MarR family transcriptional regulator
MRTKEILLELIDYLDKYEQENANGGSNLNTSDFLGFINSNYHAQNIKVRKLNNGNQLLENDETNGPNTDISILIVLMFRYAKGYIKKALKDSQIKTADEFSFLITLFTHESMIKTELIQNQIMEKTSGTDIINRLLKQGLIEQYDDALDKRSVRVKITQAGRIELLSILPQMQMVSQIVSGNLNDTEKNMLAYSLRKLETFHNDIFMHKKGIDLNELISK